MSMIVIPFHWKDLPEAKQSTVVPICVAAHDDTGSEIDRRWFSEGVVPLYRWLLRLSKQVLDDKWRASEITERAVHTLWRRHGCKLGTSPQAQVATEARHAARDVRSEATRSDRRHMVPYLESDAKRYTEDYSRIYEANLDVDLILERMRQDGSIELEQIAIDLLRGRSVNQIARDMGIEVGSVTKRINRWKKENVIAPQCARRKNVHVRLLRNRAISKAASGIDSQKISES